MVTIKNRNIYAIEQKVKKSGKNKDRKKRLNDSRYHEGVTRVSQQMGLYIMNS